MSTNTIPERADGTTIFAAWANDIRTALLGVHVPRNTSAVPTDIFASLGSDTYRWLGLHLKDLYMYGVSGSARTLFRRAAGGADQTITWPSAITASVNPLNIKVAQTGELSFEEQLPYVGSSGSGTFSTASQTFVDVTNLSLTIVSTGRPLFLSLAHDGSSNQDGGVRVQESSGQGQGYIEILRDATPIAYFYMFTPTSAGPMLNIPGGGFLAIDTPTAGSYTYKVRARVPNGGSELISVRYQKLIAYEL